MINVVITAQLTEQLVKTYLGRLEGVHDIKETLEVIHDNKKNAGSHFIALSKPATMIQNHEGIGIMPDPIEIIYIDADNIRTIGIMHANLRSEYTRATSEVITEGGVKQEIVQ